MIKGCWDVSLNYDLMPKLSYCSETLQHWGHSRKGPSRKNINRCKEQLECLRNKFDPVSIERYKILKNELSNSLLQEEDHWKQRAKQFWLREGDSNTRFFHLYASARKRNNQLERLKDNNGSWVSDPQGLNSIVLQYFQELFATNIDHYDSVINAVDPCVSDSDNTELLTPFTVNEFKEAVFSMHQDKSPRPDGFNPTFTKGFGIWLDEMCLENALSG